jgi:hypothetical protein
MNQRAPGYAVLIAEQAAEVKIKERAKHEQDQERPADRVGDISVEPGIGGKAIYEHARHIRQDEQREPHVRAPVPSRDGNEQYREHDADTRDRGDEQGKNVVPYVHQACS